MIINEIKIVYKEIVGHHWNYIGDTISDIVFIIGIMLLNIGNNGNENFKIILTISMWFLLSGTTQSLIYSFEILIRNHIDFNLKIYGSIFKIQLIRIVPWFLYKLGTLCIALFILWLTRPSIPLEVVFSLEISIFMIFNIILLIVLGLTFSILCAKKTRILTVIGFVFYCILFLGRYNNGNSIYLVIKYMPIIVLVLFVLCIYILREKKSLLFE